VYKKIERTAVNSSVLLSTCVCRVRTASGHSPLRTGTGSSNLAYPNFVTLIKWDPPYLGPPVSDTKSGKAKSEDPSPHDTARSSSSSGGHLTGAARRGAAGESTTAPAPEGHRSVWYQPLPLSSQTFLAISHGGGSGSRVSLPAPAVSSARAAQH
jgi:hypothetical protein